MRKFSKLEAFLFVLVLIFFGVQGMVSGEVSAFQGRDGSIPSATFTSPLVPWIGLVLVLVGVYILVRFFLWKKK